MLPTIGCRLSAPRRASSLNRDVGNKMNIHNILLIMAGALPITAACTSGQIHTAPFAATSSTPATDSYVNSRLQQIMSEYNLMSISYTNGHVVVYAGLLTSEKMVSLQSAIKQAVGADVTVHMIIK